MLDKISSHQSGKVSEVEIRVVVYKNVHNSFLHSTVFDVNNLMSRGMVKNLLTLTDLNF